MVWVMKKMEIIQRAIEINGQINFAGLEITAIKGIAKNGNLITGCLTPDLMGYMQIRKAAIGRLVAVAQEIMDREQEIRTERNRQFRAALDL